MKKIIGVVLGIFCILASAYSANFSKKTYKFVDLYEPEITGDINPSVLEVVVTFGKVEEKSVDENNVYKEKGKVKFTSMETGFTQNNEFYNYEYSGDYYYIEIDNFGYMAINGEYINNNFSARRSFCQFYDVKSDCFFNDKFNYYKVNYLRLSKQEKKIPKGLKLLDLFDLLESEMASYLYDPLLEEEDSYDFE